MTKKQRAAIAAMAAELRAQADALDALIAPAPKKTAKAATRLPKLATKKAVAKQKRPSIILADKAGREAKNGHGRRLGRGA